MKTLIVSIQINKDTFDIIVKDNQKIDDVIKVLEETGTIPQYYKKKRWYIKSWRLRTIVNKYQTFKQASIENGDILRIMESI